MATSSCQCFLWVYGVSQTSSSWSMLRSCGTLNVVAADADRDEDAWVLRRNSTMRVNIRVLVCDFLKLSR